MTSYRVDGALLLLTIDTTSTFDQRMAVYHAIAEDPLVPDAALLLCDARQVRETYTQDVLEDRIPKFFEQLGPKLGSVCAMLVSAESDPLAARLFQIKAGARHVTVGLFQDLAEARRWLGPYARQASGAEGA